ncbi:unnamed protein product [Prorocentrum cordatum]|uniref:Uncharacterized protein n=1 Tax=Prorocentrum cordatum TaxID=2364126 RepID=A0ABN9UIE6_9DINO|nr:unnamed protein product [Polarella glacialis]
MGNDSERLGTGVRHTLSLELTSAPCCYSALPSIDQSGSKALSSGPHLEEPRLVLACAVDGEESSRELLQALAERLADMLDEVARRGGSREAAGGSPEVQRCPGEGGRGADQDVCQLRWKHTGIRSSAGSRRAGFSSLLPQIFSVNAIRMLQNEEYSFTEVAAIKRRDRLLQAVVVLLALAAALAGGSSLYGLLFAA